MSNIEPAEESKLQILAKYDDINSEMLAEVLLDELGNINKEVLVNKVITQQHSIVTRIKNDFLKPGTGGLIKINSCELKPKVKLNF